MYYKNLCSDCSAKIENQNRILFAVGTNCELTVTPYINNEKYTLQENDKIIFTVKSRPSSPKIRLQKVLTMGDYDEDENLTIKITPEDTVNMTPYEYCYDCGLQFADGSFYIFIELDNFTLTPAISQKIVTTQENSDGDNDE